MNPEQIITELAARQHGVVARAQLVRAGVSADLLDHRLRAGRLRQLYRGVYLVGPLMMPSARVLAAVLACGEHAVLSHRHAAVLWEMMPGGSVDDPIDIIVRGGRAGSRPGICVRRVRSLGSDEVTVRNGIPVTTPSRTLLDLAGVLTARSLERALAEGLSRRIVDRRRMMRLLERHPNRRGCSRLRPLLADDFTPALTRSRRRSAFSPSSAKPGSRTHR